jgi:hypothetical protein
MRGPAFFAYADNYLIDVKVGGIMDVEASRAIRQAEVGAAKTMIERTEERFGIKPERLAADTAYGSGANLNWARQGQEDRSTHPGDRQVEARGWDLQSGRLHVRQGAQRVHLPSWQDPHDDGQAGQRWETLLYHASTRDCRSCLFRAQCCPKTPFRRVPRSIYEEARDLAGRDRSI